MSGMAKNILDASVIIKWFINEENSDKALLYLQSHKEALFSILIPNLLFYELGNIFLSKQIEIKEAEEAIQILQSQSFIVRDISTDANLFTKTLKNARRFAVSFYDASYVTLMEQEECTFVTADKKLYEKIKSAFPQAKLL